MGDVVNIDANESEQLQAFFLDEKKFAEWSRQCDPTLAESLRKLLCRFFQLWSNRLNEGELSRAFFMEFMKIMAVHGIPFGCHWKQISKKNDVYSLECCYKFPQSNNIIAFFNDVSDFEDKCRWNIWKARKNAERLQSHSLSLGYHSYRSEYMFAARYLNYRAMMNLLANSKHLRRRIPPREVLAACTAFESALQVTIASDRDSAVNVGSKLLTLAQNCVVTCSFLSFKNPVLMLLSEALTTALIQGDLTASAAIIELESKVDRRVKNIDDMNTFFAYRFFERFVAWNAEGQNPSPMTEILADELGDQLRVLKDERATIFVEAAVVIYVALAKHASLAKLVLKFVRACPSQIGRIHRLLLRLDLHDEAESALETVASEHGHALHPSSEMWLAWCENRLKNAARYGPLEEVYVGCVRVLFDFLDFGSNRGNDRAWIMLWTFIQTVSVNSVTPLWAERSSWWLRFHTVKLSPEAERCRSVVISALQNEAS